MIVCAASNNAGKLKELRRILERMGHEDQEPAGAGDRPGPRGNRHDICRTPASRPRRSARPAACPPWPMTPASAPTRCTVRPASTAPATPGITATTTRTTQSCCGSWPTCRRNSAAQSFVSAVCFMLPDGRALEVEGECPGRIAFTLQNGGYGFGYDPLFIPDEYGAPDGKRPNTERRSYAQLTPRREGRHQPPRPGDGEAGSGIVGVLG